LKLENICIDLDLRMTNASILTHTDFKVKSHGAGAYCGGHLAAQLVDNGRTRRPLTPIKYMEKNSEHNR